MRYMQMIKRCKISLKKTTSDMEAHGEEQAKRCTMSAADLRTSSLGWEERLGHLRHSAVARLLIEGKLPADSGPSGPLGDCTAAMDLSKSSVLDKARNFHRNDYRMKSESMDLLDATADKVRHQMGVEMEALKTRSMSSEVRFGGWKCRYCPYTANTSKKLYSHYQFHQQLLASQSSKPHMEWLTAYRQARDFSEGSSSNVSSSLKVTSSTNMTSVEGTDACVSGSGSPAPMFPPVYFPPNLENPEHLQAMRANGLSLRYLLGGKGHLDKETVEGQKSASGCLRSIVQAVMQQGTRASHASTTSIYASLNTSSPSLSPKVNLGGIPAPLSQLPNHRTLSPLDANTNNLLHNDNTGIVRPQPRRVHLLDLQTQAGLAQPNGIVDYTLQHQQRQDFTYTHNGTDCTLPQTVEQGFPVRQSVTVECQVPLSVPERPASRDSTSSFTSSASSEINVDDSPPAYKRVVEPVSSNQCQGGMPSDRGMSRKRSHSLDSNPTCHGPTLQHNTMTHPSIQTEEFGMNQTTKMIRLDYTYDPYVKEERLLTSEIVKPRNTSPPAVISSTGTPPPPTTEDEKDSNGSSLEKLDGIWKRSTQDISIQCELLVPPSGNSWPNPELLEAEALASIPDQSTSHEAVFYQRVGSSPVVIGSVKCPHCGIMFDDSVLHSIHMGCHSHSHPFLCNVCGEQCGNKYGFYTHIMRGHHKH